ncbi:MAG TPA: hypothetical protein VNP90_00585 [Actinomycetota bacterium]|nr:hypothetical protein [Actinomycetota bacterium]
MEEPTPSRSRRLPLIGVGLVVLFAIGAIVLLTQDDDAAVRTAPPRDGEPSPTEGDVAPETPVFRFTKATKEMVRTSPGRIKHRDQRASERAAIAVRDILDALYTEGFLDPANWEQGRYEEAFRAFTGGARKQAEARTGLLTAGARAGDRYERILPVSGRIDTRILLDRGGKPTLLVSVVRFSAAALGPEPATLRSSGQFFFERGGGSWRIVAFHVTRRDVPREAA